jgi:hypothetical protein
MAKEGDGSRVAKEGDGWLSWYTRLLATAAHWLRIQTSLKNTKWAGEISKGVDNIL